MEQWPGENADPLPQLTTRGVGFSFHNKIERIRCLFMFEVCLVKLHTTGSTPRVTHLNPHYTRIKVAQLSEWTPLPAAYLGTTREQMANTNNNKTYRQHIDHSVYGRCWFLCYLIMLTVRTHVSAHKSKGPATCAPAHLHSRGSSLQLWPALFRR